MEKQTGKPLKDPDSLRYLFKKLPELLGDSIFRTGISSVGPLIILIKHCFLHWHFFLGNAERLRGSA